MIRRLIIPAAGAADTLLDLMRHVCRVTARELPASGVSISVMTDDGVRGLSAASDEATERLEDLQFILGEGPCVDAFDARHPVLIADVSGPRPARWPIFADAAREDGIRAVFAFPLQIGGARLGAMDVFRRWPGPLTEAELRIALLVADTTVEAVLDRQQELGLCEHSDGLVVDVGNRAQLFQAQGMVMVQLGVSLGEAVSRLRAYAFAANRPLGDVARDVVDRRLTLERDAT